MALRAGLTRIVLCGLWFLAVGTAFLAMDLYV
jgi:hypothetical protein